MPALRQWGTHLDDAPFRRHRGVALRGMSADSHTRGLGAMTDNRTNEPTPEQIEAAAQAVREVDARAGLIADVDLPMYRARAALVAAARVAPQADSEIYYCPIHGDLLDPRQSRSQRCFNAPDGHEYAALEAAAGAAPRATGSTSDGYHTFDELHEYRMLYNAHAAHGWLAAGIPVVKSWKHSDGEPCFGGGWFIVTATLPAGQVSNHYEAKHWGLFQVPEVELQPEYDGHTPQDAAMRLRIEAEHAAPVQPPSTVDEAALAEVIESSAAEWGDSARVNNVLAQYIARAITEHMTGGKK